MRIHPIICGVLSAAILLTSMPVNAGMIGTERVLEQQQASANRTQVDAFMARADVRAQMETLGVSSAAASERIAALTETELQQMAENINQMPAGGSAVGVVLMVLLILVLLELLGAINIFAGI